MEKTARIFVAGHRGLIGSAVVRHLRSEGYENLLLCDRSDLELTDAVAVDAFFVKDRPEYVVLAAGRVGGIVENQTYPADFMNANLAIQLNVLKAAHRSGVRKLILFASSCMYPRECPQPMAETALLSGYPEPTSLAYAISKLAGMQMCLAYNQQYGENRFIPLIPNSVYGPFDNFDAETAHVLAALIGKFHAASRSHAPVVRLWGSGTPRREFIHADDLAKACVMLLDRETSHLELPLNVGSNEDVSIRQLAEMIAHMVNFRSAIEWDVSKLDGAPRKLLDSARLNAFGWRSSISLEDGLRSTYRWYLEYLECIGAVNREETGR